MHKCYNFSLYVIFWKPCITKYGSNHNVGQLTHKIITRIKPQIPNIDHLLVDVKESYNYFFFYSRWWVN